MPKPTALKISLATILFITLAALGWWFLLRDPYPWRNPALAPEKRAQLLVKEMTLEEKIAFVTGDKAGNDGGYVGHISAIPRLGIPELNMKDGPSGVGNGANNVTAFPAPLTVAAAWDPALMQQYAQFMAEEQRGKGVNVHLAPMMNLVRVPQAGRNFEGYGEDPFLAAQMAAAEVRGIQSTGLIAVAKHYIANEQETQRTSASSEIDPRTLREIYLPPFKAAVEAGVGSVMCSYNKVNGVYACEDPIIQNDILKGELGFSGWIMSDWNATHSTIESALGGLDMEMPGGTHWGRTLQGTVEAGQVPEARLDDMVTRILTSMFRAGLFDREPVGSPTADVQTPEHTALARNAAAQGMVLLKNDGNLLPLDPAKIKSIAVFGAAADVDPVIVGGGSGHVNAPYIVTPLQGIKTRAGSGIPVRYFDLTLEPGQPIPPDYFPAPGLTVEFFNTPDLSGDPALASTAPNIDSTWSAAPAAGVNPTGWSARWSGILSPKVAGMYNLSLSPHSRLFINDKLELDNWNGSAPKLLRLRLVTNKTYAIRVEYAQTAPSGELRLTWFSPESDSKQVAAAIAAQADVAIVIAGVNSAEGSDRQTLDLPDAELVAAVAAANPRTIVVVYSPAQVLLPFADDVPALLLGWIPGQQAGNALADVLFGDLSPSGRLPVTFARQKVDYPASTPGQFPGVSKKVSYSEGLLVGYRHFDANTIQPLFPFGHGLSYTTFEYSNLRIDPAQTDAKGSVTVTADVTNTGQRPGAEVVQLYLGFPAPAGEPPRQLKGFQKLTLNPGETRPVTFTLTRADFSIWSLEQDAWAVIPGQYQVLVGASSRDIRQTGVFSVTAP